VSVNVCRAPGCTVELRDGRYRYCVDHADMSAHRGSSTTRARTSTAGSASTAEPVDTTARPRPQSAPSAPRPKTPAATGTVSKLLIVVTLVIMRGQLARRRIPDTDGRLAETLAFSDTEAVQIARPIARLVDTNRTASRVIGPVVRNEDILGAVMAVMDWQARVRSTLDTIGTQGAGNGLGPTAPRPRPAADVAKERTDPPEPEGPDMRAYAAPVQPIRFGANGQVASSPIV
jgi:hypothetical protein